MVVEWGRRTVRSVTQVMAGRWTASRFWVAIFREAALRNDRQMDNHVRWICPTIVFAAPLYRTLA
jgi:hypothetical protein